MSERRAVPDHFRGVANVIARPMQIEVNPGLPRTVRLQIEYSVHARTTVLTATDGGEGSLVSEAVDQRVAYPLAGVLQTILQERAAALLEANSMQTGQRTRNHITKLARTIAVLEIGD